MNIKVRDILLLARIGLLGTGCAAMPIFAGKAEQGQAEVNHLKSRERLDEADKLLVTDPSAAERVYLEARTLLVHEVAEAYVNGGQTELDSRQEKAAKRKEAEYFLREGGDTYQDGANELLWRTYEGRSQALQKLGRGVEIVAERPEKCPHQSMADACARYGAWLAENLDPQRSTSGVLPLQHMDLSRYRNAGRPNDAPLVRERNEALKQLNEDESRFVLVHMKGAVERRGEEVVIINKGFDAVGKDDDCFEGDYELDPSDGKAKRKVRCKTRRYNDRADILELVVLNPRSFENQTEFSVILDRDTMTKSKKEGSRTVYTLEGWVRDFSVLHGVSLSEV